MILIGWSERSDVELGGVELSNWTPGGGEAEHWGCFWAEDIVHSQRWTFYRKLMIPAQYAHMLLLSTAMFN